MRESPLRVGVSKILLVSAVAIIFLGATAFYLGAQPSSRSSSGTSSTQTVPSAIASESISTASTSANSSTSATSSKSTGESSSTVSPVPCALSYRVPPSNMTTLANGTQITENAIPALVMGTGSTMELCVEYTNASPNPPYSFSPTITALQWTPCFPTCESPAAKNFSTSASPASILLSQGQSTVVEYTISAGANSTGFVGLYQGYYLRCIRIPVSVGYPPSQVNVLDFPGYSSTDTFCPPSPVDVQIIGFTGGSVVYLTEENRG